MLCDLYVLSNENKWEDEIRYAAMAILTKRGKRRLDRQLLTLIIRVT